MFIVYLQVFHPKTVPGRLCVSVWPRSMCLHSAQEGRPLRTVSNLCCSREMMESEFIFFFCCCWTVQQMFSLTGFSMKCLFKCTTKSCWKIKYCYKWNFKCTNKQIIHFFIIFALLTYFWQNNHDYVMRVVSAWVWDVDILTESCALQTWGVLCERFGHLRGRI